MDIQQVDGQSRTDKVAQFGTHEDHQQFFSIALYVELLSMNWAQYRRSEWYQVSVSESALFYSRRLYGQASPVHSHGAQIYLQIVLAT